MSKLITTEIKAALLNKDEDAIKYLKQIKKGIYLHIYKPSQNIYEKRTKREHIINANLTVIKPGKFTKGLLSRCKGYHQSWKYKSNDELCFLKEVNTYLLVDLSNYTNEYVARIEGGLMGLISYILNEDLNRYEKGSKSEYRIVNNNQISTETIDKLSCLIKKQLDNDFELEEMKNIYIK